MFKSIEYYLYLMLVLFVYYALPKRFSKLILLLASYILYIYWEPTFFWVLLVETVVVYYGALLWSSDSKLHFNKNIIFYSVIVCLSMLVYFKYRPYLIADGTDISGFYNLLRPLGISFFTFQGIAYLIDVQRGRKPSSNIIEIALYLSFFPQLVAGPIERAKKLIPQFSKPSEQMYQNFSKGIFYIAFGLFLKIFVADNLELYVRNALYSEYHYTNVVIFLGGAFFTIQLYADFSAYSLIAIGSASLFGITLSENFRRPFTSGNVSEFWRRWHMTLMLWLRDYIYVPLAKGKIVSKNLSKGLATFFVFMFFAIWHGLSLNLLLFGVLNFVFAFYDAQFLAKSPNKNRLQKIKRLIPLTGMYLSIIFLAATDAEHAKQLIISLFSLLPNENFIPVGVSSYQFGICIFACVVLFFLDYIQEKNNQTLYIYTRNMHIVKKFAIYLIFINLFIMFGEFGHKEFAYFGF